MRVILNVFCGIRVFLKDFGDIADVYSIFNIAIQKYIAVEYCWTFTIECSIGID